VLTSQRNPRSSLDPFRSEEEIYRSTLRSFPNVNQCKECHEKSKPPFTHSVRQARTSTGISIRGGRRSESNWLMVAASAISRGAAVTGGKRTRAGGVGRSGIGHGAKPARKTYMDVKLRSLSESAREPATTRSGLYLTASGSGHHGVWRLKSTCLRRFKAPEIFVDTRDGKPGRIDLAAPHGEFSCPKVMSGRKTRGRRDDSIREGVELIPEGIPGLCASKGAGGMQFGKTSGSL